jgi:diguanylate cyclase (GGDEF)-like protein/PAS domain S-box-containing protein
MLANPQQKVQDIMLKASPDIPASIADLLLDVVFLIDNDGRIAYVSAACESVFGYRRTDMIGRRQSDFMLPEDREATEAEALRVLAGEHRVGFQNRYRHRDGHTVPVMWSARLLPEQGLRVGVARDMSAIVRAELLQQITYEITAAAHRATDLAGMCADLHPIIARVAPVDGAAIVADGVGERGEAVICFSGVEADRQQILSERLRNWPRAQSQGGGPVEVRLAHGDCSESWRALALTGRRGANGALFLRDRDGQHADFDTELFRFLTAQVAIAVERQQLHAELLRAARYDDLTGLPNRRLFNDRLRIALARARRSDRRFALLFLDVDRFKQVNDTLGHGAGDRLLQEVAERLANCARDSDTVARLGGDEFVVLAEELARPEDAVLIADKIRAALAAPVHVGGQSLSVRASVGIALFPGDGELAEQLLRHADAAMYADKCHHANAHPA